MSVHSPPPQRPDGASRGAAREWLESERRRSEAPAFFSRSDAGPVEAGAAGDAPQQRETGALGILQSERTASLVSIVVFLSVASFMLRGVTVGRVVLLAAGCLAALACFGATRYLRAKKPANAPTAPGSSTPGIEA